MEFRRTVPAGQFCLFTVTIVDYIISRKRMFQTFGDAFDYIQKYADGAEIFEVKSDSFSVQYTFLSHDIKHSIHFATATIMPICSLMMQINHLLLLILCGHMKIKEALVVCSK